MGILMVGQQVIPIKNLFYMLCYAWNVLPVKDIIKVSNDDFGDAYNLLGKVFSLGVAKVVKAGFHRSYVEEQDELSSIRGKVNIQASISTLSFQRKALVCIFDEYSVDDSFNGIIKFTIKSLLSNTTIDVRIKRELRKQILYFSNVSELPPSKEVRRTLIFNQNNSLYRFVINVAIMIYDNSIVNEATGTQTFADFYREKQMQRVFELFLLNFYKANLDRRIYKISAPKVYWQIDSEEAKGWEGVFDIDKNPGDRRTDIVIESRLTHTQYIFDAKYYRNVLVKKYRDDSAETYRVAHLNQLRGYLHDSSFDGYKVGALLYPTVHHNFDKGTLLPIKGSFIIIKTINLNRDWRAIEGDLLDFLERMELQKTQ